MRLSAAYDCQAQAALRSTLWPIPSHTGILWRHSDRADRGIECARANDSTLVSGSSRLPLSRMGNATGYADVNGLHMYYEITGAGPPLLAMAGGTQSLEMFSDDIELLSKSFTVLAPEQMGHGRTADATDRAFDYHDMAEATYALLVHLEIESTLIYGFSDGGILGLDLAIHHPERVQRLAVSGTNFHVDGLEPSLREWIQGATGETWPENLRVSYEGLSPDGPSHWHDVIERIKQMWVSQPDYAAEALAQITAPTLVISGDHDVVTLEHTVALFRAIPNAQLCVVPNEGHGVLPEKNVVSFLTAPDSDPGEE